MHYQPNCYIIDLSSEKSILDYKKVISIINSSNPYYSFENINDSYHSTQLKCFVLSIDNQPIIALPFNYNPIVINNEPTPYFDVSSPYGFSGPLYASSVSDNLLTLFWSELNKWYLKNNVVTEFIRFNLNFNYRCYNGELVPTLLNVKGSLLDMDQIWENFKPKVRNNVRKAEKEKLECLIYHKNITEDIISVFHEIYISTMLRNKAEKRYFFDLSYFKSLIKENEKNCAIAIVYTGKTPISTEFLLISEDTIYSHLGGTVADYFHYRPNDFLKLKIMSWGHMHNMKSYVLGGGRKNGDGLYDYKKAYFPKDPDIIYYTGRKIVQEKIYNALLATYKNNLENTKINSYFPMYRFQN